MKCTPNSQLRAWSKTRSRSLVICGILLWATAAIASQAQTYAVLHKFDTTDGQEPYTGLVQATNGDLYGTTEDGGANLEGALFRITSSDIVAATSLPLPDIH